MALEQIITKVCLHLADKFRITVTYKFISASNNSVNVRFIHRDGLVYKTTFTEEFINAGKFDNVFNDLLSEIGLALTKLSKIDVNQELGGGFSEGVRFFDS